MERTETFATIALPATPGEVRQLHGRGDEVWGAQSADDSLIVIRPRR
jgi:streptogramin lyase